MVALFFKKVMSRFFVDAMLVPYHSSWYSPSTQALFLFIKDMAKGTLERFQNLDQRASCFEWLCWRGEQPEREKGKTHLLMVITIRYRTT
jgi:hypothetical protein